MRYSEMDLPSEILRAVEEMGFVELTEIQEKALPPMMEGEDVIAKAPTGTGKTCAFGIPLLLGLDTGHAAPQSLVLAPTRELAQQITADLRSLSRFMPDVRIACVYGGEMIRKQITQLKQGPHIIVATPGRLLDHMGRRSVRLEDVTRVILDEADEMVDMGFYKDVIRILDAVKNKKQMGMFSATISREVMDIGWLYQRDPVEITVQPVEASMPKITQYSIATTGERKLVDVFDIIVSGEYDRVMVFCNEKYTTEMLRNQLARYNLDVECLNGDMNQADRNRVMSRFKEGKLRILVCTDIAARGIDVEDVEAVINYDIPTTNQNYTHRIGRTGRARKEGVAYILHTPDDRKRFTDMVRLTRNTVLPAHFDEEHQLVVEQN